MKKSLALIFVVLPLLCMANNFIHRDGKQLRDASGKTVQLKGVNLGGWLLWEGWIWGGKFTKQTEIFDNIRSVAGENEAAAFRDDIYRNYIGKDDIRKISEMGFNVVRVPFNNRIFDTASCNAIGWQVLDSLLAWCAQYHVYAVLDMHGAPGGQSPYFIADPEKTILWKSEADKQLTVELWKKIADHFKNNTWVAGYDLLNEPIPSKDADLLALYKRIIAAVRSVDKNHLMILEGSNFAKKFDVFASLPDENMAFSFHLYTWFGGKPEDKIGPYVALENKLNVPIWCGEWGENNYAIVTNTLNVLSAPANGFSGWCFWTWKKVPKPNSTPALNAVTMDESWMTFFTWCCKPSSKNKPSSAEAVKQLHTFENAMRFTNTKQDATLAGILSEYAKMN